MGAPDLSSICDECGSAFHPKATKMAGLCAECAHRLYAYLACAHVFAGGSYAKCGWDGGVSAFLSGGRDFAS